MKLHESAKSILSEATYGQAHALLIAAWKRSTTGDLEDFFQELSTEYKDMTEVELGRLSKEEIGRAHV